MSRIRMLNHDEVEGEVREIWDEQVVHNGRMTNMKRTLAHSLPALKALLEWYPLYDAVVPFLGERATRFFSYAISAQTDCLICTTFFRRILIDTGEDLATFKLDEREQAVVEFGRQLALDANGVSDELYARLASFFDEKQIVLLTAFGTLMLATNVFNNALKVDLDDYLFPYRQRDAVSAPD
jgi:alkylhydroperoxidase family enzyme